MHDYLHIFIHAFQERRRLMSKRATAFDPSLMQQYADTLYERAQWLMYEYMLQWGAIAYVVVLVLTVVAHVGGVHSVAAPTIEFGNPGTIMVAVVAAIVGARIGRRKGFELRLEAQRTLCQLAIEDNTRKSAHPVGLASAVGR
jgi:hypothetical protein